LPFKGQEHRVTATERPMETKELLTRGAQWLGVLILVVAAMPLLAVAALVLRTILVPVALIGVVGGCLLYCVYPRFREWARHGPHHTHGAPS